MSRDQHDDHWINKENASGDAGYSSEASRERLEALFAAKTPFPEMQDEVSNIFDDLEEDRDFWRHSYERVMLERDEALNDVAVYRRANEISATRADHAIALNTEAEKDGPIVAASKWLQERGIETVDQLYSYLGSTDPQLKD